ncbi:transcription initiation factor TFIID component TAF4 family-domain-containing protein, partial [Gorgonomyces haynaldii]
MQQDQNWTPDYSDLFSEPAPQIPQPMPQAMPQEVAQMLGSLGPEMQPIFLGLVHQLQQGLISQQQFSIEFQKLIPKRQLQRSQSEQQPKRQKLDPKIQLPTQQTPIQKKSSDVDVTKLDVDSMMDVTSYGGVDLKEEEFSLAEMAVKSATDPRDAFKDVSFLNSTLLDSTIADLAAEADLGVEEQFSELISIACCDFISTLLERMCKAADHRTGADLDSFVVQQVSQSEPGMQLDIIPLDDVKRDLYKIEQRERIEHDRVFGLLGPPPMPEDEAQQEEPSSQQTPKDKKKDKDDKKKKPRTIKKDLPESVKNKLTNTAAMMAAGGPVKSWMTSGTSLMTPSAPPKKKPVTRLVPQTIAGPGVTPINPLRANKQNKGGKRITLKDALFTMDQTIALQQSGILYKWWAQIK